MSHATPAIKALGSGSRLAILQLLRADRAEWTLEQVSAQVGLHPNTTREHLSLLVSAQFVEERDQKRPSRGRPHKLYQAVERPAGLGVDAALRERMLDMMLASYARLNDGGDPVAVEGDDEFGLDPLAATQLSQLELHFEDLGFDPVAGGPPVHINLLRCPLHSLAKKETELVCAVHTELARSVLEQSPGPLEVDRLEPFVEPDRCVLFLRHGDGRDS